MTDAASPAISKRDVRRRRSLMARTVLSLFGRTGALLGGIWIALTALLAVWAPFIANSRPLVWVVKDEHGQWVREFLMFRYLSPQDVILSIGFLFAAVLCCFYKFGSRLVWVWVIPMAVVSTVALVYHLDQEHGTLVKALDTAQQAYDAAKQAGTAGDELGALQRGLGHASWEVNKFWLIWVGLGALTLGLAAIAVTRLWRRWMLLSVSLVCAALLGGALMTPTLRVQPLPEVPYDTVRGKLKSGEAKDAVFVLIPYSPDDLQVDVAKPTSLPPGPSPGKADLAADMVSYMEAKFGIRLYMLDQEAGTDVVTPAPVTVPQAYDGADRLWAAYQARNKDNPDYDPSEAEALNKEVRAGLEQMEQDSPIGERYHVMGTTSNGEDLASRMVHGSRIALVIGFISTGIAVFIGIIIGGLLGYFAGWVDLIGLRLVEIFASIPVIMLLIMIVAFYGRSLLLMMVVLGLTGWVGYAYFIRAEFLKLRKMDYVMAARAAGTPLHLILFRHMLPNGVAPVLVGASFGIAGAIMTEATLSFLGLGLENEPSWGQMLNQARQGGSFSWWLAICPGAAIFLTVFAYNLIGEALRDVIDPRAVE